jgi:hypothetical protein
MTAIADTPFTIEWLQNVIVSGRHTVDNTIVECIPSQSCGGKGYVSEIVCVDVRWQKEVDDVGVLPRHILFKVRDAYCTRVRAHTLTVADNPRRGRC